MYNHVSVCELMQRRRQLHFMLLALPSSLPLDVFFFSFPPPIRHHYRRSCHQNREQADCRVVPASAWNVEQMRKLEKVELPDALDPKDRHPKRCCV